MFKKIKKFRNLCNRFDTAINIIITAWDKVILKKYSKVK